MKTTMLAILITLLFSCDEVDNLTEGTDGASNPFKSYSNEVILDWSKTSQHVMNGPAYSTLIAARVNAMVHIAMHDALNNISGTYETYALEDEDKKAHPIAAAATAAHTVLVTTFPDKKIVLDSVLNASLIKISEGDSKDRGISLGIKAGNSIAALRADDGAFQDPIAQIPTSNEPGVYQAVPPFPFVYAPFWASMKTLSIQNASQFRVAPLPGLTSEKYTNEFNEVKSKGAKNGSSRTEGEAAIAKYWYEFSEIGWVRITQIVASEKNLDLLSTARLFALVNMALVDSYTAGWDSKFHYNFWRPYSAIRAAETDGNASTSPDKNWESFLDTPPVQDYPSTHSTLGNAAAVVLASVLGDNTTFSMTSPSADPQHPTRTFTTFSYAARENAESRVLAGLHFRFSCEAGLDLGKKVGQWTVENHLKPVKKI